MGRPKKDDHFVITTINITQDQFAWLKQQTLQPGESVARFVRELIDAAMKND